MLGTLAFDEQAKENNMRKLVTITFVTMDGVMQAPGGPGEDDSGGFQSGGWSFHYWDDMMNQGCERSLR